MSVYQRHELVETILARCTNNWSDIHGVHHWRCVAWSGRRILESTPTADPLVVLLFAMFHDSMREDDGSDPHHGRRAGAFVKALHGKAFRVTPAQLTLLTEACNGHVDGRTSTDPTIGACWDADRLNLWRVGLRPEKRFLSTKAGQQSSLIQETKQSLKNAHSWQEVFDFYEDLDR